MTFLAPWAAWFLAGIPIIVLLYLLKLKRRALSVSTVMFWERVLREQRRRALFQRLRNLLSLLLHLLIFLLIVGALAKPTFDHFVRAGSSTVVIIDARARMQAVEANGESRFETAKKRANAWFRQANRSHQFALLSAHASPQVIVPFTDDERALHQAMETLVATDAGGDIRAAIALAKDLVRARKGIQEIVVFTDQPLPRSDNATQPPAEHQAVRVEIVALGQSHDNVAITRFAARPLLASPETSELLLEVSNFSNAPARGNVELQLDGSTLDVRPFQLEPGERKRDIFPSVPRARHAARGWLTARWSEKDALTRDNIAYAVLKPPERARVLLVTRSNWFLEKLLAADHSVQFELLTPDAFQPAMAMQFDAVILDDLAPESFNVGESAGNVFFLKRSPFSESGAVVEHPLITDIDQDHPVMRTVNLQNVTIVRAQPAPLPPPNDGWNFQAAIRSFDDPLFVVGSRQRSSGEQRVAILHLDVTESDLPLRVAFPLLISNTIRWLSARASEPPPGLVAGERCILSPEQRLWTEPQTTAAEFPQILDEQTVRGFFVPLRNGYYLVESGRIATWMPVNTFNERESDLRQDGASPSDSLPSAARGTLAKLGGWSPWQLLALGAIALTTLEWALFHRRRTE